MKADALLTDHASKIRPAFCEMFVYLASQSPRRAALLRQIGVSFELLLPDADEDAESLEAVLPNEAPTAYVARVTALKLQAAMARRQRRHLPPAPVICSDTTVDLGRQIFGKPASPQHAVSMLTALAGRTHRVITGVAMGYGDQRLHALCTSRVRFAPLGSAQIQAYVDTGEPMGKAGAYAVQGLAAGFIEHLSGSYSGIMGLPLFETMALLRQLDQNPHTSALHELPGRRARAKIGLELGSSERSAAW